MANEILRSFADNTALMNAVKELLLAQFDIDALEATDSDILLGQIVRARLVGIEAVKEAFRQVEQYKSIPPVIRKTNPSI